MPELGVTSVHVDRHEAGIHHRTQPGTSDKSAGKLKNTPGTCVRIPHHHQPPPGGKEVCVLCYTTGPRVRMCPGALFHSLFGSEGKSNMLFLFTQ